MSVGKLRGLGIRVEVRGGTERVVTGTGRVLGVLYRWIKAGTRRPRWEAYYHDPRSRSAVYVAEGCTTRNGAIRKIYARHMTPGDAR